jgi:predicted ATPase
MESRREKKIIIVCGKTGSGKTTILNHLAGRGSVFKPRKGLQSDTDKVTRQTLRWNEYDVELIDTIGFLDNRNFDILKE